MLKSPLSTTFLKMAPNSCYIQKSNEYLKEGLNWSSYWRGIRRTMHGTNLATHTINHNIRVRFLSNTEKLKLVPLLITHLHFLVLTHRETKTINEFRCLFIHFKNACNGHPLFGGCKTCMFYLYFTYFLHWRKKIPKYRTW